MGLFSSPIEKQLEQMYVRMFQATMGMSASQAKEHFKGLLDLAKKNSKESGGDRIPPDFAERLLTDEKLRPLLEKRKKEGVTDEDIRWWWGMQELERQMMMAVDDNNRMVLVMAELEEGKTMEQATATVRKFHPIFGDPEDTEHTKGEDRPLPHELKDRINKYIEKRATTDPEQYKKEIKQSSTFNALIRKEIRAGKL